MRRKKPAAWPRYMTEKTLRSGGVAYYWQPPGWAVKRGCPVKAEALGPDFADAVERCNRVLNPQFDAWRSGRKEETGSAIGTLHWVWATYKASKAYSRIKSKREYDASLAMLAKFQLKNGVELGAVSATEIDQRAIQRIYDKLVVQPSAPDKPRKRGGKTRATTINRAMRHCKRAWRIARKAEPDIVPTVNPFTDLDLEKPEGDGGAKPATRMHLQKFMAAADAMGRPEVAAAALIAFELLLRKPDVLHRFAWADWRPEDNPDCVMIRHGKTGESYPLPLYEGDGNGSPLFPELVERIEQLPKLGPLVLMQAHRGVRKPLTINGFNDLVPRICERAGLPHWVTFASFRKGGMTELGEAGLSDSQILSHSGHRTRQMVSLYSKATRLLREDAAKQRLAHRLARTKAG